MTPVQLKPESRLAKISSHAAATTTYLVRRGADVDSLMTSLRSICPTRQHANVDLDVTYLDTVDLRMTERGVTLRSVLDAQNIGIVLDGRNGQQHIAHLDETPAFASELPTGPVKDYLRPIIGVRRLLPLVHLRGSAQTMDVLDKREKIIGWITVERLTVSIAKEGNPLVRLPTSINIEIATGFDWAMRPVIDSIKRLDVLSESARSTLDRALAAIGKSSKPPLQISEIGIEPDMRADIAIKKLLLHLVDTMVATENGLRENLDSEFLHDFRVAARRTQSALTQLKNVFPAKTVAHFRQEFKWLRKTTNPVRDLDVQILHVEELPFSRNQYQKTELDPLIHFLKQKAVTYRHQMTLSLNSQRYKEMMTNWRQFLLQPTDIESGCGHAEWKIIDVAAQSITTGHRRLLEHGRSIDNKARAKELHRLRLDCKKVRYLLEFFTELFDRALMAEFIGALKRLQDHLGDFQDLQVQQETLRKIAHEMTEQGPVPTETLLAVGRIIGGLESRQKKVRKQFDKRFAKFLNDASKTKYRRCFGTRVGDKV